MNMTGKNNHSSNGLNGQGHNHVESHHNDNDEIDLIKLASIVLQHKWTLLIFVFTFSALAAILSLRQIPIYSSEGTIFISESKNRYSYAGSDLSNLLTTTYGIGVGSTIANELQILKSRTISEYLADSLMIKEFAPNGHKYPILWRAYPHDSSTVSRDTVAMRIRNTLTASQVDRETDIVRIGFESPLAEEAAYVVNLTMNTYSQLSTEQNRLMATSALNFLRGERDKIQNQLYLAESQLEEFMDESALISVDPQTQQLINTVSALENKKQEIEVALAATNSALDAYTGQLEQIGPGLAQQYSESLPQILERYQYELAEKETEKLLLLSKNPELREADNVPELTALNRQIDSAREQIKSIADRIINSESQLSLSFLGTENSNITHRLIEINQKVIDLRIQQAQYQAQISSLDQRINELNMQFDNLPEDMIRLGRLKRDVRINEELYLLVSNQYAEMSLWERTQFGLGRPLDYALVPKKPVKPQKKLWVVIGFMLGGITGLGFIFVREAMDSTVKSSEDFKVHRIPFLGFVPDYKITEKLDPTEKHLIKGRSVSNQLLTFIDHISPISEAYRRVRINAVYSNPDRNYKVLMVTSSTKGEGKSTIASNLAVTFAETEKKVLIVDLDLRRPTLHKLFGEAREPGLVDVLFDTEDIKSTIKPTVVNNVDLLTVGRKTPEPATVLESQRLRNLINKLKDDYDHIILDTAPHGIISDSAPLLSLIDGLILVSRFGMTTKKELQFTIEGLRHINAPFIGIVLNGFDPKKSSDYYSNYYYYKRTYSEYYKESV